MTAHALARHGAGPERSRPERATPAGLHCTIAAGRPPAGHIGTGDRRPAAVSDAGHEAAWLDIFWTAMAGVTHAVALGRAAGMAVEDLLSAAEHALEAARDAVPAVAGPGETGADRAGQPTVAAGVAEMERVIHAAQACGLDASVMRSAASLADRVVNAGQGEQPIAFMATALGRSAIRPHAAVLD